MADRTKTIGFGVSPREKAAIRQAAAREDKSMAVFVRERVLNNITAEKPEVPSDDPDPLSDFITARLHQNADADPLPKTAVYQAYQNFCEEFYPDHQVETQHKVSREIGALDGVDSGRRYVQNADGRAQKRCFTGLRWSMQEEESGFS